MNEKPDDLKLLKDISVEWFKIHADQRMKAFNFFIIISGFLFAGYFTAASDENRPAAIFVGVLIFLVCIVFKMIDLRTSQLLKISERSVEFVLENISTDFPDKNLIKLSNNKGCTPSYRQSFNTLFFLFGVTGLVGAVYQIFLMIR